MTSKEPNEPLDVYEGKVRPEWIDGSGHMYAAYYVVAFGEANDAVLDLLGLGENYRREAQSAPFLVELHTTSQREMLAETEFRVTFQLLQFDSRRMRYFLQMFHAEDGYLVATVETAIVHVDLKTRKTSDFPDSVIAKLSEIYDRHEHLDFPPQAGRGISLSSSRGMRTMGCLHVSTAGPRGPCHLTRSRQIRRRPSLLRMAPGLAHRR